LHAGAPLNPGCINRNHTHGTHAPVEEPSTASEADIQEFVIHHQKKKTRGVAGV
jgi:hypothetical protein